MAWITAIVRNLCNSLINRKIKESTTIKVGHFSLDGLNQLNKHYFYHFSAFDILYAFGNVNEAVGFGIGMNVS